MSRTQVDIKTADGICPTSVFTPNGAGSWPGVIFYMDGPGIRPLLFEMGERLASAGYVVLLPDLFYRAGPYAPIDTLGIGSPPSPITRPLIVAPSVSVKSAASLF